MPPKSSTMLALGTTAPGFALPDHGVHGHRGRKIVSLDGLPAHKPILIMFICNHCPFVIHVKDAISDLDRDYGDHVSIVAINSNNIETHPADAPPKMEEFANDQGWRFPYLFDETQEVAMAYEAACTPDFFLFDAKRSLVYRGQLDDSRPSTGDRATGADLRDALDAVLAGKPAPSLQKPSLGCGIKWKPGNGPA